ncbi:MAG TPA: DinB family protein [Anaerolineales bacterium]|nr:DinB family protein [Anaerolineales bacterium]
MSSNSNKLDLLSKLKDSNQRVINWFTEIPAGKFFHREGEVWSASDNVDHLIRSHKPIALALKLPRLTLRTMFGAANQPSRSYEAICGVYKDTLAAGGVASGKYLPNQQTPAKPEVAKMELLNQFSKASADVVSVAEKWNEDDLDGYLLPHPLIGKLTIREMLYFTIYHNLRHASQEGD